MNQSNNVKFDEGSIFERKGNDILCEVYFIEQKLEAIRKATLISIRNKRPLDKRYIDEKGQKIVHSINDILRHIDETKKITGRDY